jgi:ribonuclease PH
MNVAMTEEGEFVEIQGTAEGLPFSRIQLQDLIDLAEKGILELVRVQKEILDQKFDGRFQTGQVESD